jgi:crotonobetainyl-CoA:carnitine CoA-transferase CaiB-like acyl-CoA transferase
MVVELDHPEAGRTSALGLPVHFSATPAQVTRASPLLGEHTREVLGEAGYSGKEIDELIDTGVVEQAKGKARATHTDATRRHATGE